MYWSPSSLHGNTFWMIPRIRRDLYQHHLILSKCEFQHWQVMKSERYLGVRIHRSSDSGVFFVCLFCFCFFFCMLVRQLWASLVSQTVKNPPAMQEILAARFRSERSKIDTLLFHELHDFKASHLDFLILHFLVKDNMYYIGKLKIQ